MGKGGGAPQAPNPKETASAQTASNVETAKAQARLNSINQVTPYGNLEYTSGEEVGGIPQYTVTQTLSPTGQQLFDATSQTQQNLANLGQEQSSKLSGLLNRPFSLDNDAVEGRLMELGRKRLDPILADQHENLRTELINSGIRPGSTAYAKAIESEGQNRNDAYNNLLLKGRGQAISEALAARQQPINEIIGLSRGTQLQNPQLINTPQTGVGGTDVAGITQNAYGQQMNSYNQQQQRNQQMMGGLFGLGANAMMAFSDKRLKKDISKVGTANNGLPIYSYKYKAGGPQQLGLMAQDVEKVNPEAVGTHESGFKMVDYSKAVA
jgi:hypothetical protein